MAKADDTRTVNFREFRKNLSGYLRQVRHGESLVVTSRGEEVARILPPAEGPNRAALVGLFRNRLRISTDFDEPLPELVDAMESAS